MHLNTFVGREEELNILKIQLKEAQEGNGQVVFIQGEAGSGKSSLVKKFISEYENNDKYTIADSECTDKEGINAYLPFKEILIKLNFEAKDNKQSKKQKFEHLKNFVYQAGSSWVNLIPIIGNLASAGIETYKSYREVYLKDNSNQIQSETEIHQTFENEFRNKAQNKTLLIFLDDIQWCDNASLNFLFTLCRNIRKIRSKYFLFAHFVKMT
jgi:predicted ATPase